MRFKWAYWENPKRNLLSYWHGYIDVGDGCWWRNLLMSKKKMFEVGRGFGHFGHQHQNSVTNFHKLSPTLNQKITMSSLSVWPLHFKNHDSNKNSISNLKMVIINNLLNRGQFGLWCEPHFEFSFCIWIQSYLYHPQNFFVPFIVPKNWHNSKRFWWKLAILSGPISDEKKWVKNI